MDTNSNASSGKGPELPSGQKKTWLRFCLALCLSCTLVAFAVMYAQGLFGMSNAERAIQDWRRQGEPAARE